MLTSTKRAYEIIAKDIIGLTDNEYKTVADDIDDKEAFHIRLSDIPSNALFSNNPADASVFDIKSIEKIEKDDSLLNKANRVFYSKSINASKQFYGYVDEHGNQKPGLLSGVRKWKNLDSAGKKQAYEKLKFYQENATNLAISDGEKSWDNKWLQAANIYASALELPGAPSAQQIWSFNVIQDNSSGDDAHICNIMYAREMGKDPAAADTPSFGEGVFKAMNEAIENAGKDMSQNTLASSGNKITEDEENQDFNINQSSHETMVVHQYSEADIAHAQARLAGFVKRKLITQKQVNTMLQNIQQLEKEGKLPIGATKEGKPCSNSEIYAYKMLQARALYHPKEIVYQTEDGKRTKKSLGSAQEIMKGDFRQSVHMLGNGELNEKDKNAVIENIKGVENAVSSKGYAIAGVRVNHRYSYNTKKLPGYEEKTITIERDESKKTALPEQGQQQQAEKPAVKEEKALSPEQGQKTQQTPPTSVLAQNAQSVPEESLPAERPQRAENA